MHTKWNRGNNTAKLLVWTNQRQLEICQNLLLPVLTRVPVVKGNKTPILIRLTQWVKQMEKDQWTFVDAWNDSMMMFLEIYCSEIGTSHNDEVCGLVCLHIFDEGGQDHLHFRGNNVWRGDKNKNIFSKWRTKKIFPFGNFRNLTLQNAPSFRGCCCRHHEKTASQAGQLPRGQGHSRPECFLRALAKAPACNWINKKFIIN